MDSVKALSSRAGFNVCDYAGADPESVRRCRRELAEEFGVGEERLVIPRQTHSTHVAVVSGPGPHTLPDTDGMVTAERGTVLCINTADCVPLLMADPVAGVITAVHCGWRGTVAGIAAEAVRQMVALGADPAHIEAEMGPCIGPECFEVGEEVAAVFPEETVTRGAAKPHVDLPGAVALQLRQCGVPERSIRRPQVCSRCSQQHYSVRRQGRDLPYRTVTAIALV